MILNFNNIKKNIANIIIIAMFFSCTNNTKKVRDFLIDKNKPIGEAKNIYHVYKSYGKIVNKLRSPILYDFSNRKNQPYNEFPKGVKISLIKNKGRDSITIKGNYAISYIKTGISEIKGDVVIINYKEKTKLQTNSLFWDQKEAYFFTEDGFRLTTPNGVFNGFGFESRQDLKKWIAKDITGEGVIEQKNI